VGGLTVSAVFNLSVLWSL